MEIKRGRFIIFRLGAISTLIVMAAFSLILGEGLFQDVKASAVGISPTERAALIALYNSTTGDSWTENSGWKDEPVEADGFATLGTENTWYGITCDVGNTYVHGIELEKNNLNGSIPAELGNLSNLYSLSLYSNQLSGSIPTELGNLTNLQNLWLYENALIGPIPTELGNLTNLKQLALYSNQLIGPIPTELGNLTNLEYLDLSDNQLNGSIPTELGNLTNLQDSLRLKENALVGPIPTELGNLTNLKQLALFGNQLSGSIPAELGNLTNLEYLALDDNQLSGSIPTELGNLTNLQEGLWLYNNALSGSIPAELGNLTNLKSLELFNNQLSGSIPAELGNLTNLLTLYLFSNQLSGPIPTSLTNLTALTKTSINLTAFGHTAFGRNALYTDDNTLIAFLDTKDPGWSETQTIAPSDFVAQATGATTISLSWTPIDYTDDSGGYEIYKKGSLALIGTTEDKTVDNYTVSDLTPGTTYTFILRTKTDSHEFNQNTVYSEYTEETSVTTEGESITITSTDCNISNVTVTESITGTPFNFTVHAVVSFTATGVTDSAYISINYISLPADPTIYKIVDKKWIEIYPENESDCITGVTINGDTLSYTIADNSDCDSNDTLGTIEDPVAVGTTATPSTGDGGSSSGGCFITTMAKDLFE